MKRKTADELMSDLRSATDRYVEAKQWLDRAESSVRQTLFQLKTVQGEIEQRMLEAPAPGKDGG